MTHTAQRRRRLAGLGTARDGTAAIELALGFLTFVTMVIGIIEMAMLMLVNVLVEGGLRDASRFGITGQTPAGISREATIIDMVAQSTLGLVQLDPADITFLIYPTFDDIGAPEPFVDANGNGDFDAGESFTDINGNGQWDPDMGAAGLGGPGDIVVYRVTYDWAFLTTLIGGLISDDGTIRLTASIAVRNEPFTTGT